MSKRPMRTMAAMSMMAAMAGLPNAPLIKAKPVKEPRMPLTNEELEKLRSFDTRAEDRTIRSRDKRARKAYVRELESKYADYLRARVLGLPLPTYNTGNEGTESSEHSVADSGGVERTGEGHEQGTAV